MSHLLKRSRTVLLHSYFLWYWLFKETRFFSSEWTNPSVTQGPAVSDSPWNSSGMQSLGSHPRTAILHFSVCFLKLIMPGTSWDLSTDIFNISLPIVEFFSTNCYHSYYLHAGYPRPTVYVSISSWFQHFYTCFVLYYFILSSWSSIWVSIVTFSPSIQLLSFRICKSHFSSPDSLCLCVWYTVSPHLS